MILKISSIAAAVAALVAVAGITACHHESTNKVATAPSAPSPSGQLIGTPPAPPTGDTPQTTPVTANTKEITKTDETTQKPQEGDNHAYSSVAKDNPQKAGGQDPQMQPGRKKD